MDEIIKALEIIGTIAFAISGALVGIGASLDIFGVVFVSCVTAFGGGMLRDVLLGITPPAVFNNIPVFLIAMATAIIVFIIAFINKKNFEALKIKIEHINNFFDALGLAAFSVIGSEIAYLKGFSESVIVVVIIGMITGVGGGIFRDILTDTTPFVFKKHIYAVASIMGSFLYFVLRTNLENIPLASVFSMLLVFVVRMLATKYRWSLPRIRTENKE